jgi:hypothetical protein
MKMENYNLVGSIMKFNSSGVQNFDMGIQRSPLCKQGKSW